ncbi:MAG: glycerophosphodiester phosphodiesterase [Thermoleophilia bacterium]
MSDGLAGERPRPWVIAHRGASWDEKENTLAAFERAIADGADFLELDVQVSADGALVVFHDLDLDRLTPLTGPLRRRSMAELAEVGIPTLEQVIELARGRIGIMAELKSAHLYRRHGLVERTVALLSGEDVVVSFQRRALLQARRLRPELHVLQHVGLGVSIRTAARYAWAVGFWDARVTRRGIARAHAFGLLATVYTVNDERRMRELAALGVDGIFTDRPGVARAALAPT